MMSLYNWDTHTLIIDYSPQFRETPAKSILQDPVVLHTNYESREPHSMKCCIRNENAFTPWTNKPSTFHTR